MLCGLIMAGGKGTRFWPKSTYKMPKQFLNLVSDKTMIQLTYDRLNKIIPAEKIFILTAEEYKDIVVEQIPNIAEKNIIIQPAVKNTAPCILLSILYINQIYPNCNIAVLPSDHAIKNDKEFGKIILKANNFIIEENSHSIITIGITPGRPETGYGYIKSLEEIQDRKICKVEKFVEKPNLEKAKEYLREGSYLWNAGIFVFNSNYMLEEFKKEYNYTYELFKGIPPISDINYNNKSKEIYLKAEEISIDYAIMEKSNSIYVIPGNFGWDDIGTWSSLKRYINPDNNKNYLKGNVEPINSKNNVIYAGNKKVILFGIDDIFCIDSEDVLIIGKNENLQEVHELGKRK